MSAVTGGDIRKMIIQHPTAGSCTLYGVSGETSSFKKGGMENEDNGAVNGAGQLLVSKKMIPGHIEMTASNDMAAALSEVDFCQRIAKSTLESKITVEHINGVAYGGKGIIAGEITLDGKASTFKIKVVSGQGFERL